MTRATQILCDTVGGATRLTLSRPGRANSLTPDLLHELGNAIDAAQPDRPLIITGAGQTFSAGGDILGFLAHAGDSAGLTAYGRDIVESLNTSILALCKFRSPVLAAVNGPVTGGALGLALAADRIVMADTTFVQPWYAAMGFAPDGGWTAMLPGRIGAARANAWITGDDRQSASSCLAMGVCDRVVAADQFDAAIAQEARDLSHRDAGTIRASRALAFGDRAGLTQALNAERDAFIALIARPETIARMRAFAATPRASDRPA